MSSILAQVQTASQLYEQQRKAFVTTGCSSIDICLKGGIPLHGISEERLLERSKGLDCGRSVCR